MEGTPSVGFRCTCGELQGKLSVPSRRAGTHLICYCADCRATQLFHGRPDPAPAGVELYQTTPDLIRIDSGRNRLGLIRLRSKGLLRWYASCCNTPLFNTLSRATLPFAAIEASRLENTEPLGAVVTRSFIRQPGGGVKHEGVVSMAWGVLSRMAAARISGRWRQTPFFDLDSGAPVVEPRILTRAERAALYPR